MALYATCRDLHCVINMTGHHERSLSREACHMLKNIMFLKDSSAYTWDIVGEEGKNENKMS